MPVVLADQVTFRKHIPELDGFRGLAVLLVVLHHVVLWHHQQAICTLDRVYAYGSETGWVGVEFFFVLSGFLITGILVDARADPHYFRNFYARRVLRIFPLYYGVLLLLLVVFPALPSGPAELRHPPADGWSYWLYLSNFTLARETFFSQPRLVTWSLAIEEQFYLLWPAVVWACGRRGLPGITLGMLAATIGWRVLFWQLRLDPGLSFLWTPSHLDGLALGALVAMLVRQTGGRGRLVQAGPWIGMLGLFGVAMTAAFSFHRRLSMRQDPIGQVLLYTFIALVGVWLLIAAVQSRGLIAAAFRSPLLRFVGKYSYGIYLYQSIVLAWVVYLGLCPVRPLWGSLLLAEALFLAINLAATLTVAVLSYHLFERQFLRLKRYFPETSVGGTG